MLLGAGLFAGLAAGASAGGRWLLGGIVLAGALAALSTYAPSWHGPVRYRAQPARVARALVLLALAGLLGRTFAAYLVPDQPLLGALSVIALGTAVAALGLDLPVLSRRVMAGLLLLAAAGFVAVCAAAPPPAGFVPLVLDATPAALGVPASAAVLFALFTPLDTGAPRRMALARIAVGTVAALAVGWAALDQIGPVRLGLADTSLREVLVSADAAVLITGLHALLALVIVVAAAAVLAAAREELHGSSSGSRAASALLGGALAGIAALFPPAILLPAASTVALGGIVLDRLGAGLRPADRPR